MAELGVYSLIILNRNTQSRLLRRN